MKQILFLVLIFSTYLSFSQNRITDTTATCIAFWNKGEKKIYQISHNKEKYFKGDTKLNVEVKYEAHINIIDSLKDGYIIDWRFKNFKSSEEDKTVNGGMNEIMEGLTIKYKIDDVGAFAELLNWKEVRDYAFNSIDKMVKEKPSGLAFNNVLSQTRKMFETRENIEAVLIKEVQLFHTPYGVEYNITGVEAETELPNVSGGEPFPARITIKLDKINAKENYCKVSLNQIIDKGKAGPIILSFMKKMAGYDLNKINPNNKTLEEMEISDVNEFTYALDTGWITKLIYKRTLNVLDTKQIETYQFVVVK